MKPKNMFKKKLAEKTAEGLKKVVEHLVIEDGVDKVKKYFNYVDDESEENAIKHDISPESLSHIKKLVQDTTDSVQDGVSCVMKVERLINTQIEKLLKGDAQALQHLKQIDAYLKDQSNLIFKELGGLKNINANLEKIHEFSREQATVFAEKFNHLVNDLKEIKDVELARKKREEFDNQILGIKKSFQFCKALGKQINNKDLEIAATIGMAATEFYAAGVELIATGFALGPVAAMGLATLAVFSLFSKKKKSGQDSFSLAILQNLRLIAQQIYALHENMRELFNKNFENQRAIYYAIVEGFARLETIVRNEIQDSECQLRKSYRHWIEWSLGSKFWPRIIKIFQHDRSGKY